MRQTLGKTGFTRYIWALLAVMALTLAVLCACAEDANPIMEVEVTANPDSLSTSGDVTLTFRLSNLTDETLHSVSLITSNGLQSEILGSIGPAEIWMYEKKHSVTQSELDAGLIFYYVSFEYGDVVMSKTAEATISKTPPEPKVEFTRQFSSLCTGANGALTIVYQVRNTGNIAVKDLVIRDPLGGFVGEIDRLEIGECRRLTSRMNIFADVVSAPELVYSAVDDSSEPYTESLADVTIRSTRSMLNASFTAGRSLFSSDTAETTLVLTNDGSVDYEHISVLDDALGGVIADSISLPAGGEPVEITHTYPLRGNASYRWRIMGANAAGERVDFVTETINVAADQSADSSILTLSASTDMPIISRSGYVTFQLTLTNHGTSAVNDVRLYENGRGDVRTLAVVPSGEATVVNVKYEIRENSTLAFFADYVDASGQSRTASADSVQVRIAASGVRPETDEDSALLLYNTTLQSGSSKLFIGLLIGSCLVLLGLLTALLITSRKERKVRKQRAAERKQRLHSEFGKTNPFKPVKQPGGKK